MESAHTNGQNVTKNTAVSCGTHTSCPFEKHSTAVLLTSLRAGDDTHVEGTQMTVPIDL